MQSGRDILYGFISLVIETVQWCMVYMPVAWVGTHGSWIECQTPVGKIVILFVNGLTSWSKLQHFGPTSMKLFSGWLTAHLFHVVFFDAVRPTIVVYILGHRIAVCWKRVCRSLKERAQLLQAAPFFVPHL